MEAENLAIGKILYRNTGTIHSRIKVKYVNSNNSWLEVSDGGKEFPPEGNVFAKDIFTKKFNLTAEANDIIVFRYKTTQNQTGPDTIMIDDDYPKSVKIIYEIVINNKLDQSLRDIELSNKKIYFSKTYKGNEYLYGPYKKETNGNYVTDTNVTEVSTWEKNRCTLLRIDKIEYIYDFPEPDPILKIDTMTNTQLANWLKGKWNNFPSHMSMHPKEIRRILSCYAKEPDCLQEQRWERIENNLAQIELDYEKLCELAKNDIFRAEVKYAVNTHIDKFINVEKSKIKYDCELFRRQQEEKTDLLKADIVQLELEKKKQTEELRSEIADLKEEKTKLEGQLESVQIDYTDWSKRKTELVSELKLNLELFSDKLYSSPVANKYESAYVIEKINVKDSFIPEKIRRLKDEKKIKVEDVNLGIQFMEVTGGYYLLLQPNPDWIKFEYLWYGGLNELWKSCWNNTGTMHYLFIQNINIAHPSCWGQPLWNILDGKRTMLPLVSKDNKRKGCPSNFKVIACLAEDGDSEECRIGLPIPDEYWKKNGWK